MKNDSPTDDSNDSFLNPWLLAKFVSKKSKQLFYEFFPTPIQVFLLMAHHEWRLGDLFFSAIAEGQLELVQVCLNLGIDINATLYGKTPLYEACDHGDLAVVNLLLKKGAEVNVSSLTYKDTPLGVAAEEGHAEVVVALLLAGAKMETTDTHGRTAFIRAASQGHVQIMRILLEAGAKLSSKALFHAAFFGQAAAVQFLLTQPDIDVNTRDDSDRTALMEAADATEDLLNFVDVAKLLIAAGIDLDAQDYSGETALMMARRLKHSNFEECLLEAGAKDIRSYTPIYDEECEESDLEYNSSLENDLLYPIVIAPEVPLNR